MQSSGRGVDNTPEGWMTDYLISVLMLLFAVRLRSRGASAHAALTQLFMAAGYLFGGIAHHLIPNRAVDSPCGDRHFYIVWMLAYAFQAASCVSWCTWADQFVPSGSRMPTLATCATALASVVTIVMGTLWCVLGEDVQHQAAHLRLQRCRGARPRCDEIVQSGELLFYGVWVWAFGLVAFRNLKYLRESSRRLHQSPLLFTCMWYDCSLTQSTHVRVLHCLNLWVTLTYHILPHATPCKSVFMLLELMVRHKSSRRGSAEAPLALFLHGPSLMIFGFAYAVYHKLDAEHVAGLYAQHHLALIYHAGVISCHFANYYVSHNVELISKRIQRVEPTPSASLEGASCSTSSEKAQLLTARGG